MNTKVYIHEINVKYNVYITYYMKLDIIMKT